MKRPPSFLVRDGETTIIKMAAPDLVVLFSIMLALCLGLMIWCLLTPEISGGVIGALPLALAFLAFLLSVLKPRGNSIACTELDFELRTPEGSARIPWKNVREIQAQREAVFVDRLTFLGEEGTVLGSIVVPARSLNLAHFFEIAHLRLPAGCLYTDIAHSALRLYRPVGWGLILLGAALFGVAISNRIQGQISESNRALANGGMSLMAFGALFLLLRKRRPEGTEVDTQSFEDEGPIALATFLLSPSSDGFRAFAYPERLQTYTLKKSKTFAVFALALFYAMFLGLPLPIIFMPGKSGLPLDQALLVMAICGSIPALITIYLVGWYRRMHRLLASIHDALIFENGQWFVQSGTTKLPATLGPVKNKTGQHDQFSGLHWSLMTVDTPSGPLLFDPANMLEEATDSSQDALP